MYLDWSKQGRDYYAVDIEANDLLATKVWCVCWENIKTGETGEATSHAEILKFFEATKGSVYVGHNFIKYDAPTLNRLVGTRIALSSIVDTLVLSTLYNPSLTGGHSLGEWGVRLNMHKGDFSDWSRLSEEMLVYCRQDVKITAELYRRLCKVLNKIGFSEKGCEIQHKITAILERQHKNGFYFDGPRGIALYQQLRTLEADLQEQIHNVFPPVLEVHGQYKRAYRKDGSFSAQYLRHCSEYERVELTSDEGAYRVFGRTPFNIGSPDQRVEKLQSLGWEHCPDEVTKTGKPKPFDKGDLVPSLRAFLEDNDVPEVKLIAKWMAINGRANMINTWLENWNDSDSCIHGKLFVADTLRFRHQAPNTANIPAVRLSKQGLVLRDEEGFFTYEARDLWTARPDRVLVGTDAAGLELRMLAHYLNRPDFTKQVVEGDPHQYNADLAGVTRPLAKTLLYAIQYGAQAKKVAAILKRSLKEGAQMRTQFLERLGIKGVMDDAINEQQQGRIFLVDGSGVICPSPHAALNYKLQGGGARVMAQAAIILEGYIRSDGLDCLKVGDIHDEWQYDCDPRDARQHAIRSVQAIREAGEELNLNVPLDGEAKQGRTWAETH